MQRGQVIGWKASHIKLYFCCCTKKEKNKVTFVGNGKKMELKVCDQITFGFAHQTKDFNIRKKNPIFCKISSKVFDQFFTYKVSF